jgi:MHS family proline/betaine transporter-like MFS transporter
VKIKVKNKANKKINFFAAIFGSGIELYDYVIYGICSIYFAEQFFPSSNANLSYLASMSALFAGFLFRPLGAIYFGFRGDKKGRKNTLYITLFLMGAPTLLIAILPTYYQIGIAAPIILVLSRIVQGIAFGGESAGASIFLTEHSSHKSQYFPGAIIFASAIFSSGLALILIAILDTTLGKTLMQSWGWRIPFASGAVIIIIGLFIRNKAIETPVFIKLTKEKKLLQNPLKELFKQDKKTLIHMCGIMCLSTQAYLLFVFMPSIAQKYYQLDITISIYYATIAAFLTAFFTLIFGKIADKTGGKILMVIGSSSVIVIAWPLFLLLRISPLYLIIIQLILSFFFGMIQGPLMGILLKSFRYNVRFSGVAISYNISYALFGGLTPLLSAILISYTRNDSSPAMIVIFAGLITLISCYFLTEKKDIL